MDQPITIKSKALKKRQLVHAWAIVAIPFVGTAAALVLAIRAGVGAVEISLLVGFYCLTILGITVGFHRHFTHHAFATSPALRAILGVAGSMACQGPVIYWVSNHRRHHRFSDAPGDPHSPFFDAEEILEGFRGFWHAHLGWTFTHDLTNTTWFAKDLIKDPVASRVNRMYYLWVALSVLLPTLIGGLVHWSWHGFVTGFLWGGVVRLFLTLHATNAINSVTHMFGRRPFATHGHATNNAWLAIPVFGEGWHNNHHAFPDSAVLGLEWWQIDMGAWLVLMLEKLGLVWQVRRPTRERIDEKLASSRNED